MIWPATSKQTNCRRELCLHLAGVAPGLNQLLLSAGSLGWEGAGWGLEGVLCIGLLSEQISDCKGLDVKLFGL